MIKHPPRTFFELVILDRDGVINEDSVYHIKSPQEWRPIPGSLAAIAKLNQAGATVVIASNQSGIARGFFDEATLTAIHQKMQAALAEVGAQIDAIFYCPHGPDDDCNCRKPKTGLLEQIAQQYPEKFNKAIMIGDSLRDIEAAHAMHLKAYLVKTGKGERTLATHKQALENVPVYDDLAAVVAALLEM